MEEPKTPHAKTAEEVMSALGSSSGGLSEGEVRERLARFGRNALEDERSSKLEVLLRQFRSVLVYVLLAAAALTAVLGEWQDFFMIIAIIIINASIGFWQELRAETSIRALKKLTESKTTVIREGRRIEVPSSELVPGDIVEEVDNHRIESAEALAVRLAQSRPFLRTTIEVRRGATPLRGEVTLASDTALTVHRPLRPQ